MAAAELILKIRRNLFLDPQEFADALGVSRQAIFNYEKGIRLPQLHILKKMLLLAKSVGLEIKVDEFFQ